MMQEPVPFFQADRVEALPGLGQVPETPTGFGRRLQQVWGLASQDAVYCTEFQPDGVIREVLMVVTQQTGDQIRRDLAAGYNGWGFRRRPVL